MGTERQLSAGGTLDEQKLYIERPGDTELPTALLGGKYCYILAPREIGKSSLSNRARRQLEAQGVRCAVVDLDLIGTSVREEDWYFGLIMSLAEGLTPGEDPAGFWKDRQGLPPLQRFSHFLQERVLVAITGPVVVFIDEIDATLDLPFSRDDFFAGIRALYNRRAYDPTYRRLTFCVLGVAAPHDLMRDQARTPFNIGTAIHLADFDREQVAGFLPVLVPLREEAGASLEAIFAWTDGHPKMTHRMCEQLLFGDGEEGAPIATRVDGLARRLYLQAGARDSALANAEARVLSQTPSGVSAAQMLKLYEKLLSGERVPSDRQNPQQIALLLTGMAAERRDGEGLCLRVRNAIFAQVFDKAWLEKRRGEALVKAPLEAWLRADRGEACLLRGEALTEALRWSEDKDLSPDESTFLVASLGKAERLAQEQREKLASAKRAAEERRREAAEAEVEAERQQRFASLDEARGQNLVETGESVVSEGRVQPEVALQLDGTAALSVPLQGRVPSAAVLRDLINTVLPGDADFVGFCLDSFPEVALRFANGMERVRKLNLLLDSADHGALYNRLREAYPDAVTRLVERPDLSPAYVDEQSRRLGEELKALYQERRRPTLSGEDVSILNQQILELRRRLRRGPQLHAGEFLSNGRYRLLEIIGHGGFATVWRGFDQLSREMVAVKVLHGQWAADRTRIERFYRGARQLAHLRHAGIVRVVEERGEDAGFQYFVMEYMDGGDLRQAVLTGRLTLEQGLSAILQVGAALQYAHENGVIHRDVKPANILLGRNQSFHLTDFDLALAVDSSGGTRTGSGLGTFVYAAPEAMMSNDVDARSDVYSLGMTCLFVCLGKDLPYDAIRDSAKKTIRQLDGSRRLKAALLRAIDWRREARFPSVSAFCQALAEAEGASAPESESSLLSRFLQLFRKG